MPEETPIPDLATLNYDQPLHGIDEIRAANPQRFEFEMLTGIVYLDPAAHIIVGFKNTSADDWWARGHVPGYALFPGVLMCEAAGQLCGFYYSHFKIGLANSLIGLGSIEEARFTRPVFPGERLVLVGTGLRVHRRLARFRVEGFVGTEKAFVATVVGTPLGTLKELRGA